MKATIFLCLVLAGTFFGQTLGSADSRELERLENVWNEAHEHGDAATLESLWAYVEGQKRRGTQLLRISSSRGSSIELKT
jgi:hypothetical protein